MINSAQKERRGEEREKRRERDRREGGEEREGEERRGAEWSGEYVGVQREHSPRVIEITK